MINLVPNDNNLTIHFDGITYLLKNNATFDAYFIVMGPTLISHTLTLYTDMCNN